VHIREGRWLLDSRLRGNEKGLVESGGFFAVKLRRMGADPHRTYETRCPVYGFVSLNDLEWEVIS
jgi:hypothetical protein